MAAEKVKNYCFGIDVGGTTIKLGLFDRAGNVLDKWEIKTRTEENGKYILPDAAQAVLTKMSDRGLKKEEIAGIGIGVPGPVGESGIVPVAVNLHWGRVNIVKEMEEMTGIHTKAGNDENVAALVECWKG